MSLSEIKGSPLQQKMSGAATIKPSSSKPSPVTRIEEMVEPTIPDDTTLTRNALDMIGSDYNERGAVVDGRIVPYGSFSVHLGSGRDVTPQSRNELVQAVVDEQKYQYRLQGSYYVQQGYSPLETEAGLTYVKQQPVVNPEYIPSVGDVQQSPGSPIVNVPEDMQPKEISWGQRVSYEMGDPGRTLWGIPGPEGMVTGNEVPYWYYEQPMFNVDGDDRFAPAGPSGKAALAELFVLFGGSLAAGSALKGVSLLKGTGLISSALKTGTQYVVKPVLFGAAVLGGAADVLQTASDFQGKVIGETQVGLKAMEYAAVISGFSYGAGGRGFTELPEPRQPKVPFYEVEYDYITGQARRYRHYNVLGKDVRSPFYKYGSIPEGFKSTESLPGALGSTPVYPGELKSLMTLSGGVDILEYGKRPVSFFESGKGNLEMFEVGKGKSVEIPAGWEKTITRLTGLDIIEATPGKAIQMIEPVTKKPGLIYDFNPPVYWGYGGGGFIPGGNVPEKGLNIPDTEEMAKRSFTEIYKPYDISKRPVEGWDEFLRGEKNRSKKVTEIGGRKETGLFDTVIDYNLRGGIVKPDVFKTISGIYQRPSVKPSDVFDTISSSEGSELKGGIVKKIGELAVPTSVVESTGKSFSKVNLFDTLKGEYDLTLGDYTKKEIIGDLGTKYGKESDVTWEPKTTSKLDTAMISEQTINDIIKKWSEQKTIEITKTKELPIGETSVLMTEKGGYFESPDLALYSGDVPTSKFIRFLIEAEKGVYEKPVMKPGKPGARMQGEMPLSESGFINLPKSGMKTTPLTGVGLINLNAVLQGRINLSDVIQDNSDIQNQRNLQIQNNMLESLSLEGMINDQSQNQRRAQLLAQEQVTILENETERINIIDNRLQNDITINDTFINTPFEKPTPESPGKPRVTLFPVFGEEELKGSQGSSSFILKLRSRQYRNGKRIADRTYHPASKPLSFDDAMSLGVDIVSGTEKASFEIEESTERARKIGRSIPHWTSRIMEYTQTKSNRWVEDSSHRIDSPGEIREITMKGIEARMKR